MNEADLDSAADSLEHGEHNTMSIMTGVILLKITSIAMFLFKTITFGDCSIRFRSGKHWWSDILS